MSQTFVVTSIIDSAFPIGIGAYSEGTGSAALNADVFGAQIATTINGTPFIDVDTSVLTDEGASSFAATSGQTVTINRATGTGRRSEVVVPGTKSRVFNGTTEYLEVPHHDSLDLGTSGVLTPWLIGRFWGPMVSSGPYISKRDGNSPNAGWNLLANGSAYTFVAVVDEGATQVNRISSTSLSAGALEFLGTVMNRQDQTLRVFQGSTLLTTVSLSSLGTVTNGLPVRVGRNPNVASGGQNFRLYAWGIYPGALTAEQIAMLNDALRVPEGV